LEFCAVERGRYCLWIDFVGTRTLGIHPGDALLEAVASTQSKLASAVRTRPGFKVLRSSDRRKRIVSTMNCHRGALIFAVRGVK